MPFIFCFYLARRPAVRKLLVSQLMVFVLLFVMPMLKRWIVGIFLSVPEKAVLFAEGGIQLDGESTNGKKIYIESEHAGMNIYSPTVYEIID